MTAARKSLSLGRIIATMPASASWAVEYADAGLHPIQLHGFDAAGLCTCGNPEHRMRTDDDPPDWKTHAGKHPRESGWRTSALDLEALCGALCKAPCSNLGLRMGVQPDGKAIVALDKDDMLAAKRLEKRIGRLPRTLSTQTGKGEHGIFVVPVDVLPRLRDFTRREGIDLKARGQVVAGPSLHFSGVHYRTRLRPIAELPKAWLDWLLESKPREHKAAQDACPPGLTRDDRWLAHAREAARKLPIAVAGGGGTELFAAAAILMRGWLLPRETADRVLRDEWNPRCEPPWELERDGEHIANWRHQLDDAERKSEIEWGSSRPYKNLSQQYAHPDEIPSNAADLPLILQSKSTYWLRKGDGTYGSQFVQAELVSRVAYELRDQYISEEECTPTKLQSKYTRAVERVIYSYTATSTTYDAAKNVVRVAALNRKPAECARTHPKIDKWLRLLFGDSYPHGAQWIASCSDLSRPAPCLYLIGDPEIGKSLLFDGLARLWECSSPVPMAEAIDNFNEKQIECPLVFTDEGLPQDYDSLRFRGAITERERSVNRKNMAKVGVQGCVRLAIGANNSGVLRWARHGEMTQADQAALIKRLTVIECPDSLAVGAFLRDVPVDEQNAWADRQIAEHALWLAQTVPLEPDGRMCARAHGGEPLVRAIANERYAPVARLILDVLASPLGARQAHVWRSAKDDRLVYVHTQAFHAWIRECGDTRLREGDLVEACKALAAPQGHVASRQRLPKSAGSDRVYAYTLDAGRVAAAAGVAL